MLVIIRRNKVQITGNSILVIVNLNSFLLSHIGLATISAWKWLPLVQIDMA